MKPETNLHEFVSYGITSLSASQGVRGPLQLGPLDLKFCVKFTDFQSGRQFD